jgi:DnaJ-class molecular chaperone
MMQELGEVMELDLALLRECRRRLRRLPTYDPAMSECDCPMCGGTGQGSGAAGECTTCGGSGKGGRDSTSFPLAPPPRGMGEQELVEARQRLAEQEQQRGRDIEDALAQGLSEREREEWQRRLNHENEAE